MSGQNRQAKARQAKVFTWDWRGQPDLDAIALAVWEMSGGKVFMTPVNDTGTDSYVLAVTDYALSHQQALKLWERTWQT